MKQLRWIVPFAPVVLLGSACPPVKTPAPNQPRLAAVRLVGARVCAPFSVPGKTYDFTCDPLPTVNASGWQLTPPWQLLDASGHQKQNRIVVLTVTTPSLTSLLIDYEPRIGAVWHLRQKPPGPGQPLTLSGRGEVEVDQTDDGTTRTWTLTANMWVCSTDVPLRIYDVSADGQARSNPLSVTLLRADEGQCEYSGDGSPVGAGSAGGVPPPSPRPPQPPSQGPCPGGAPRREFGICENCTSPPRDPKFDTWTGVGACDWEEVLQTFHYHNPDHTPQFPKSQTCRAPRQESRVACEGP